MDDVLLTKYLLEETSEEETTAIRKWIAEHPDNRKHYSRLQVIWEASRTLVGKSDVDEHEAWQRFVQLRDEGTDFSAGQSKGMIKRMGWLRIAAALILVSAAAVIGYFSVVSNQGQSLGLAYQTAAEVSTDTLADGSIITLNNYATLRFSQGPFRRERRVELQNGEAFFRVAKNRNKPFVIRSGDVTVTVLGTSFHVKRDGDETAVVVENGKVKVEGLNREIELTARQKVIINTSTQRFDEGTVTDQLHNYYVSGSFVLDHTPLWRIAEILEEAYGVEITVARDEIRNLPMTTTLRKGALDNALDVIVKTLGVTVEKQGKEIIFK